MKKVTYSVLGTTALSLMLYAQSAEASTYEVKSGDSLWKVAQAHKVTITNLKQWNNLTSDMIHPNQTLKVASTATAPSTTPPVTQQPANTPSVNVGGTYTVVAGDSLSKIASQFKTTVSAIQSANNLSGTLIFVNQKLAIPGNSSPAPSQPTQPSQPTTPAPGATTYTVVAGDSLSKIGSKFKVTVADLKKWNGITTDLIRVGQKLSIVATSTPAPTQPTQPTTPVPANPTTYTVVAGDSLSKIGSRYKVSVANIKSWNNLTSDIIFVGQKLSLQQGAVETKPVAAPTQPKPPVVSGTQAQKIVQIAQSFIGVPYVWGGSTPAGFDCSGFIHYVYKQAGISVPRTNSKGMDARSYYLDQPQVGDLVFFANTYTSGISHLGIYIGNNQFIHAGSKGITVTSLNDSYWKKHFDSYKRFYSAD
ncbi:LysM peptidoglycan-binding domain-containing protein [Chryseomicrobium palamuruense]